MEQVVRQRPYWVYLALAPILWGGNFVVGSLLAVDLPAHWVNLLRWLIAALVLLPISASEVWYYRRALVKSWRQLSVLAFLGVAGFNTLLYAGLKTAPVSVAAVAFAVTPFMITAIIAVVDRVAPSARLLLAATIALAGMLIAHWSSLQTGASYVGLALVLLAAMFWAIYCVGLRRFSLPVPAKAAFFAQVVIGVALLLPVSIAFGDAPVLSDLGRQHWAGLVYLGVGAAALAFWFWQRGIARAGAARAAIFMNLVPISSLGLSVVFLDTPIAGSEIGAFTLVLLGILLSITGIPGIARRPPAVRRGGSG